MRRLPLVALGALLAAACGGGSGAPGGGKPPQPSQLDARLPGTPVPVPSNATEEERHRAIFEELVKAEKLAAEEAERSYPQLDAGAPGFDEDRFRKQNNKRHAAREGLLLKYRAQIAERNGLDRVQLQKLLEEGHAKGWAPPSPSPVVPPIVP